MLSFLDPFEQENYNKRINATTCLIGFDFDAYGKLNIDSTEDQFRVLAREKLQELAPRVSKALKSAGVTDGSEGVRDLSDVIAEGGVMVEPLKSKEYFERVFLDMGAPTWPNGFDIAPAWLWREMEAAGELTHEAAK